MNKKRRYKTQNSAINIACFNSRKWTLHCETGPAVIREDGTEEYWLNGKQVSKNEFIIANILK